MPSVASRPKRYSDGPAASRASGWNEAFRTAADRPGCSAFEERLADDRSARQSQPASRRKPLHRLSFDAHGASRREPALQKQRPRRRSRPRAQLGARWTPFRAMSLSVTYARAKVTGGCRIPTLASSRPPRRPTAHRDVVSASIPQQSDMSSSAILPRQRQGPDRAWGRGPAGSPCRRGAPRPSPRPARSRARWSSLSRAE
jgi:hypothetical protein